MIHYRFNSGDLNEWELSFPSKKTLATLIPLIENRGGPLPKPLTAYRCETVIDNGCAVFTIFQDERPLLNCGLAWTESGADEVWPELERLYLGSTDKVFFTGLNARPRRPVTIPWLAEILFIPEMVTVPRKDLNAFLKFEMHFTELVLSRYTGL